MQVRSILLIGAMALGLSACDDDSPTDPSGNETTVSIVSGADTLTTTAYSPNPLTISPGTTVRWVNNDDTTHTTTSAGTWDSGSIPPNASFSRTFPSAGTFPYACTIHPNMVGTVNVQ